MALLEQPSSIAAASSNSTIEAQDVTGVRSALLPTAPSQAFASFDLSAYHETLSSTATGSATSVPSNTSGTHGILSPAYLTVGAIFLFVIIFLVWWFVLPDPRHTCTCRRPRRCVEHVPLRRRGPGDAYEVNPEMWSGGGRLVGEPMGSREGVCSPIGQRERYYPGGEVCAMNQANIPVPGVLLPADRPETAAEFIRGAGKITPSPPPPYWTRSDQDRGRGER